MRRKIPATIATQHPDHAGRPYWHTKEFVSTRHETKECFLNFSELGVSEYKWDWEGKLVDESVMERLFEQYYDFFKSHPLGIEKFLTFRLPNPAVETEFRLGRAFMGLLSAATLAQHFGLHSPPLFEVILPMTTSAKDMISIKEAFQEMSHLKHELYKFNTSPLKYIQIIPLFEDIRTIANSSEIILEYFKVHQEKFGAKPAYLRPYVARSDPALNAGIVPTVLAIKIALSKYKDLERQTKIPMFPMIGAASLPFRGGLTPLTIDDFLREYPGIRTVTLQGGFRYDYEKNIVIAAIKKLERELPKTTSQKISAHDEKKLLEIMKMFESFYQPTIEGIAEIINRVAKYIPKRRERVQHVGLFGYSRGVGNVKLPRAIGFTAALYSLGIPPELIGTGRGLKGLKPKELKLLEKYYKNLKLDLIRAGKYLNKAVLADLAKKSSVWQDIQEDIEGVETYLKASLGPKTLDEKKHFGLNTKIYQQLRKKNSITKFIIKAAILRKSLG